MNELQNASELEQLSELCMTIIDRELLSEYEKKISSGISKSQQVSAMYVVSGCDTIVLIFTHFSHI